MQEERRDTRTFEEMLARYEFCASTLEDMLDRPPADDVYRRAEEAWEAAREAVLKYVEDLQEDAELQRHWQKIANGNYEDALRQITSLRASQVTPEEARAQIEGMHHLPDPRYHTWLMGRNKLRDIAGMGPQPHEVPPHMPG